MFIIPNMRKLLGTEVIGDYRGPVGLIRVPRLFGRRRMDGPELQASTELSGVPFSKVEVVAS